MGRVARELASVAGIGHHAVESVVRSTLGEHRIDLRVVEGDGPLPYLRARGDTLAAALARHPAVERATNVPPRVYVRLTTEALIQWASGREHEPAVPEREPVLVTFSDPNTNKPLHVGHLRNLFLGEALARLHEAIGHPVRREGTFGDWGVHICQALVAYLAEGEPEPPSAKPDHFVGAFYARYHAGDPDLTDARQLLRALEGGAGPRRSHDRLTAWARQGIEQTYERLGIRFDVLHSEAASLPAARRVVEDLRRSGALRRRADGCLTLSRDDDPAGDVVVARPDGTLLVQAQILGIDVGRFASWPHRIISLFGHQWESGVADLLRLAGAAEVPWIERYEPVFYGMVGQPSGSMRSREGNAPSADETLDALATDIGDEATAVQALAYHLLRQRRAKTVVFDPRLVVERSLPALRRARAVADLAPDDADLAPADRGGAPALGRRAQAAVRQVVFSVDRTEAALVTAAHRRDPSVVLQALEELVRSCEALPDDGGLGPVRGAAARAARRLLGAAGIDSRMRVAG